MNDNAKTDNGIRLNKYLSEAGICSRREADRLIEDGKVTVDGRTASMGMKVFTSQEITVNGKRVEGKERPDVYKRQSLYYASPSSGLPEVCQLAPGNEPGRA